MGGLLRVHHTSSPGTIVMSPPVSEFLPILSIRQVFLVSPLVPRSDFGCLQLAPFLINFALVYMGVCFPQNH